jgi:hypothetical protein
MFFGPNRREIRWRGTSEQYEPAKRGWGAFFDRMAERLAT